MKYNTPVLKSDVRLKLSCSAKSRLSNKINHPMYGRNHTEESISKIKQNLPNRFGEFNSNNKYLYIVALDGNTICETYSIREFCSDNNLKYTSINMKFHRTKCDVISFKGFVISRYIK
jgi:hypothetical protein